MRSLQEQRRLKRELTPSTQPLHYSLLAEHHESARKAAARLEVALRNKDEAEREISKAREALLNAQDLIDHWYTEPESTQ